MSSTPVEDQQVDGGLPVPSRWARLSVHWPLLATLFVIIVGTTFWLTAKSPADLAALGGYISGIVAAITLFWLAVGQRNQLTELSMQREELALQRRAAEQQARELHNAARIGIMTQVQSLVDDARDIIVESKTITSEAQLATYLMGGLQFWKDVDESKSADIVIAQYQKWLEIEAICKRYLACIATAMRIYQEFNNPYHPIPKDKSDTEVVYVYSSWVKDAPFLSGSMGSASLLANFLFMMEPGCKRMLLASTVAHSKKLGKNLFKDDYLCQLRDEVAAHSGTLPAICDPWPI